MRTRKYETPCIHIAKHLREMRLLFYSFCNGVRFFCRRHGYEKVHAFSDCLAKPIKKISINVRSNFDKFAAKVKYGGLEA